MVDKDINVTSKDTISRQAAIDAVYKCTDYYVGNLPVMIDKADAYKALADLPAAQPEPIKINIDHELAKDEYEKIRKDLADAPIVLQPERKTGRWIPVTNGRGGHECDQCHEYAPSYKSGDEYLSDYCPNCGAKMEERE